MFVLLDQMCCWPVSVARLDSWPSQLSPLSRQVFFWGSEKFSNLCFHHGGSELWVESPLCFHCDKKFLQRTEQLLGNEKWITNAVTDERQLLGLPVLKSISTEMRSCLPHARATGGTWPTPYYLIQFFLTEKEQDSVDVKRAQWGFTIIIFTTTS